MNNLKVLWSTFKLQIVQSLSRATFRFCIIVQPLIYTFILYMMYKDSGRPNYVNFVVLGSGLSSLWSSICFSSAGDLERERNMGTLENLFCSPTKFTTIMLGKILANTFLGLSGIVLSLIFTKVFFNENLYISHLGLFSIASIMTVFSFVAIALVICPIFTLSKNARALMNCLEYPVFILCGFVFPIDMLPSFIRPFSYMLAPTWAVKIMKDSSMGAGQLKEFCEELVVLTVICMAYIVVSRLLFLKIDRQTRIKATLGVS